MLQNCKFSNLKSMEEQNGFDESMTDKKTGNKIPFFNLGEKNNYKEMLEENILDKINKSFDYELRKFKYIF